MKCLWIGSLVLCLALVGCGEDAGGGGGGNNGDSPNNEGPAHQVDAEVEGGSNEGDLSGESEQNVPDQFFATVGAGQLVVFLSAAEGQVINFIADTESVQIPGSFGVEQELGGPGFLTVTNALAGTIHTGRSGTISVSGCPNTVGAVVTGNFNDITLVNTVTDADDGVLSGSFRATVVNSDASADCAPEPEPGNNDPGDGPSPGASCPNDVCDGPCCPYLPALQQCNLGCINDECMNVADPFGCFECLAGCPEESGMTEDQVCVDAFTSLNQCAERNGCEGGDLEDDSCLADNCCTEYKATF